MDIGEQHEPRPGKNIVYSQVPITWCMYIGEQHELSARNNIVYRHVEVLKM